MAEPHICHAIGCAIPVMRRCLFCSLHWRMTPYPIQRAVSKHYRAAQIKEGGRPSIEWLRAASAAVASVAMQEGKNGQLDLPKGDIARAIEGLKNFSTVMSLPPEPELESSSCKP